MYAPPPPPEEGGSKIKIFIIVGVLIVVLIVGLFAAWMILQNGRENPWAAPTPTPTMQPIPTAIPEFGIEITRGGSNAYLYPGESTDVTVFVRWLYGDAPTVNLYADTGSSGIQCSFSAASSRPDFSSIVTITVPYYTTPGWYTVVITGTNGATTHSTYYTIQVAQR